MGSKEKKREVSHRNSWDPTSMFFHPYGEAVPKSSSELESNTEVSQVIGSIPLLTRRLRLVGLVVRRKPIIRNFRIIPQKIMLLGAILTITEQWYNRIKKEML